MLSFRGSDYRISWGLTWYDRMDNLLMALGFTASKVDSKFYFKVEGGIPVMLLLYVDDLFLTEKWNSLYFQEGDLMPSSRGRIWIWCTTSRHGCVAKCRWNPLCKREVCSGDPKELQDDGMQGLGHTYGIKTEAIEWCFIIVGLMLWCIVRWLGPLCTWWTRDQPFSLLWTPWASSR